MRSTLFDLSRRLYRPANVLHLKWALISINRRIAVLDSAWREHSDLAYAMRRVDPSPAWLSAKRNAMRIEFHRLAAQRKEIRAELSALGAAS
ncbi:hypothetical protein WDZ92_34300 [Nostoc sp. NIES-2111]